MGTMAAVRISAFAAVLAALVVAGCGGDKKSGPPPTVPATIKVTSRYIPITPVAGSLIGPITMTATSEMPIERTFP